MASLNAKQQRLIFILLLLSVTAIACILILRALNQNIVFFVTPSDINAGEIVAGQNIRLGGLVVEDSISKNDDNSVSFMITDGSHAMQIRYQGLLPDLFREGQGIVAQGRYTQDEFFDAEIILAKHDENYMPRELVDRLKENGQWQDNQGQTTP